MIPTLLEYRVYLIALFIALVPVYFTIYIYNRNRFNTAADKFRSVIFDEMRGLIPVEGFWIQEEYPRFLKSIPIVKRAAFDFRPTLPFYRKRRFNKAIMAYCEQSQNMNWDQAIFDAAFPDECPTTQKEKFIKCIDHLLSFTE